MPTPRLITNRQFRTSKYGQLADQLDGDLDEIIVMAEARTESYLNRIIPSTTYTEVHRPSGARLFLRQYPIVALTSVSRRIIPTDSWTALTLSDFEMEPNGANGVVLSLQGDIAGYDVQVVYTAGYATIPWDIQEAVVLQTALMCYMDLEMFGVGDSKPPGLGYVQKDIDRMLAPYRKKRVM